MTCIVGYIDKQNKSVTIGADSAAVSDADITIRKDVKVFKNKDFVIGCTSSFRMIQLLRFSFKPPEITKDLYEYMCTDFIDEVRECFRRGGYLQKDEKGDEKGGSFLVAYKDRILSIEDDFQVGESVDQFAAIGCGAQYALGTLYTIEKMVLPSNDKVMLALKSASYFSGAVQEPFILEST